MRCRAQIAIQFYKCLSWNLAFADKRPTDIATLRETLRYLLVLDFVSLSDNAYIGSISKYPDRDCGCSRTGYRAILHEVIHFLCRQLFSYSCFRKLRYMTCVMIKLQDMCPILFREEHVSRHI